MPSQKFVGPRNMKFFRSQLEAPDMRAFVKAIQASTDETTGLVMELVMTEVILFLKSYTTRLQPPDYRVQFYGGNPKAPRPAHPGNWADISGQLRVHYKGKVERLSTGNWIMSIWNDAVAEDGQNLAMYVESREGYFVVSGIMDSGGVVMWTLRRALRRLAPGWKLASSLGNTLTDREGNPIEIPVASVAGTIAPEAVTR